MTEPRKLYRSVSNRMIAGVCAGVAKYLEVDPTVVRLIAAVSVIAGGAGIVAYIIAWIIMPQEPWAGPR